MKLLAKEELGFDFIYPPDFLKVVELGLLFMKPWEIIIDERLPLRYNGLKERYPSRQLIPFAQRRDCDDVACWDLKMNGKLVIIHDYASEGWEEVTSYDTFWDWFKQAVNDMIEFSKED
jgi:hypothetical protein